MNKRTTTFTIEDNNRDKGKRFLITEMDAWTGERFATDVILAMAESGVDVPDGILSAPSFEALASFGINAMLKIKRERFFELEDQLLSCVQILFNNDEKRPIYKSSNDIEEVSTIFKLRLEVLKFHFTSFMGGSNPISA